MELSNQESRKAGTSKEKEEMKKPIIAMFCTALAWVALVPGLFAFLAGVGDIFSARPIGYSEMTSGGALIFASILWFALSRIIVLLTEIAANTKK